MKRKLFTLLAMSLFAATAAFAQDKMEVKDANSNVLMQVNDEGTAGSISLPGLGAVPAVFTDKIYSIGGELYFNGVKLNTPWSLNGSNLFYTGGNIGVGTGTPNSKAVLDIDAAANDKGVLLPRLTTAQRTAISGLGASDEGLIVYDETADSFWFWSGSQWQELGSAAGDNLGDHTATQALDMSGHDINNGGTVTANAFVGDGSGLTGVTASGDNLGNHTATQTLNLNGNYLSGDGGNEGVFVANNGNVGIGTSTPEEILHVFGSSGTKLQIQSSTNQFAGVVASNSQHNYFMGVAGINDGDPQMWHLYDNTAGQARIVVKSNGNVGIGTKTPVSALDIGGGNISLTGGWLSGDGGNEGVFVADNGNVGIGTKAPTVTLDVDGAVAVNSIVFHTNGAIMKKVPMTGAYTVGIGDFVGQDGHGVTTAYSNGQRGSFLKSGTERLVAPVHLPDDVHITRVVFRGYDLHTTNIKMSLIELSPVLTEETIASHTSSTSSGAYKEYVTVNNWLVRNYQTNQYFIFVELEGGSWHSAGELAVKSVTIEYNMPWNY